VNYCFNPNNDGLAYSITRTECWPRYYIIDFGLSRRYDPSKGPPLERVIPGGDLNPPEYAGAECNPFPADIYCLGNLLKRHFIRSYPSAVVRPSHYPAETCMLTSANYSQCGGDNHSPLQFLKPLVDDMTHKNPAMRPTIGEVIQRFNKHCEQRSRWQLRKPGQALEWHAWFDQVFRQVKNTLKGVAPVPASNGPPPTRPLSSRMRTFYTKTPKMDEKNQRKLSYA
jgi:serine/threonine protein kinase